MNRIPGLSAEVVTGLDRHVRVPGHLLRSEVPQAGLVGSDVPCRLPPVLRHIAADETVTPRLTMKSTQPRQATCPVESG